jgi:hypothetical protein
MNLQIENTIKLLEQDYPDILVFRDLKIGNNIINFLVIQGLNTRLLAFEREPNLLGFEDEKLTSLILFNSKNKLYCYGPHNQLKEINLNDIFDRFYKIPFKASVFEKCKNSMSLIYEFVNELVDYPTQKFDQIKTHLYLKRLVTPNSNTFIFQSIWSRSVEEGEIHSSASESREGKFLFEFRVMLYQPFSKEDEALIPSTGKYGGKYYFEGKALYPQFEISYTAKGDWWQNAKSHEYYGYHEKNLFSLRYSLGDLEFKESEEKINSLKAILGTVLKEVRNSSGSYLLGALRS